jgi:hypothetical protein
MKILKTLLTIIFIYTFNLSYGQDKLLISVNTGSNISYYLQGQLHFPEENSYLWGFVGYYNEVNFANSLGKNFPYFGGNDVFHDTSKPVLQGFWKR